MQDRDGKQITWCAKGTCTDMADAQRGVEDRNGEKLCPRHGEEEQARRAR